MASARNIVVLGASFAGLGTAHYLLKHVFPQLQAGPDSNYVLHLVDPSTHFWWKIAAPREIVSSTSLSFEQCFVPITDGFKQYEKFQDSIVFHHATATGVDTAARKVSLKTHEGAEETLDYYSLVIATGTRSPTPLTTLQGDHKVSKDALAEINQQVASAKEIIISGGGPVGVEIAGEIGTLLKGKAKITLIAGSSDKLLPVLSAARSKKADGMLSKLGVGVMYRTKTTDTKTLEDGRTEVSLSNGQTLTCDVFISASGMQPNTEFLPEELKAEKGYVKTNKRTLRVDAAGERVYAAGDVAGVDKGGVLALHNTLPILGYNIGYDLSPKSKSRKGPERLYNFKEVETQVVPIGPKAGVGAFMGFGLPSFAVGMIKGKDYMITHMADWTEGKAVAKA